LAPVAIRILIVDDEQSIVDSLRDIIGSDGYDVMCAYSAEEALAKAAELCPDILLSDVLMPKMHGFELALQLKQICPNCHLLFFSGQAATAQLAQSFVHTFTRLGYRFELLPKPIHPETLLQKLQDSLTRAA
jgi:CheY-like chemotaxis protein